MYERLTPDERVEFNDFIAPQYRLPKHLEKAFICSPALIKKIRKFNKEIRESFKNLINEVPSSKISLENIDRYYEFAKDIRRKLELINKGVIKVNRFSLLKEGSKGDDFYSGDNAKLMTKNGDYYKHIYAKSFANDIQDSVTLFLNDLKRGIEKNADWYKKELEKDKKAGEYKRECKIRSKSPEFKVPGYLREEDSEDPS